MSEAGINAEEEFEIIGVNGEFFVPNSQFYISGSLNQVDYTASAVLLGLLMMNLMTLLAIL